MTLQDEEWAQETPAEDETGVVRVAIGRSYGALLRCRDMYVGVEGPRGTAKTTTILTILMSKLLEYPRSRLLLLRYNRTDLSKSVLATLEEAVFPAFNLSVPGSQGRETRSVYNLPNGSSIIPVGLRDGSHFLSSEYTWAYVNQPEEFSEGQLTDLAGSMRFIKSAKRPTLPDYSQIIVDPNPVGPQHWLNQKMEEVDLGLYRVRTREDYERLQQHNYRPAANPEERWKRIITKLQDNPGYFDVDRWELTPQGKFYLEKVLGGYRGFKRKRWLDGLWVSAEGTVFDEYDAEIHLCEDFDPPDSWRQALGYDPGRQHPTSIEWYCKAPDGGIYVYDEIWRGIATGDQNPPTVREHCLEIKRRNAMFNRNVLRYFADPQQFFSHTAAGSCDKQARSAGLAFQGWPRTQSSEVGGRIDLVNTLLANTKLKAQGKLPEGEPYLMICRRCRGMQHNITTWSYRRSPNGDLPRGDDQFVDADNDCTDNLLGTLSTGFFR